MASKKEFQELEKEVFEKFLIAALAIIIVPSWDKFLNNFFADTFLGLDTLEADFLYALLITSIALSIALIMFKILLRTTSKS